MLDAGVVDQDVHPAECRGGKRHHGFDVGGLAHVGAVVGHPHPMGLAGFAHGCQRAFGVAEAVEHHVRALACQGLRNA